MTLRAILKANQQSLKNSERFYLVLWPDEDTVSVHPEAEVMEPALEQCVVGSCCSIQFGRSKYKGKIACIGTKSEMLGMEIAYIKGDYTPFEEFKAAEETSSGGIVIIDKPEVIRKRKRKLLTVSAKEQEKEKNTMIGDKDKMNNEEIKSKKVKGDKGKKDAKVKRVANTGKKKKSGCIIECASGGEEAKSEDESDFEFEELLTESAKEQENEKNTMKRDKDRMDNEETMYNKAKGDKGKKDAKVKMAANTTKKKPGCITECSSGGEEAKSENDLEFEDQSKDQKSELMQRIEWLEQQKYQAMVQLKYMEAIRHGYDEKKTIMPPWYLQHTPIPLSYYTPPFCSTFDSLWDSSLSTPLSPSLSPSSSSMYSSSSPSTLSPLFPSPVYSSTSSELLQLSPKFPLLEANSEFNVTGPKSVATTSTAVSPLVSSDVLQTMVNMSKAGNVTVPSLHTVCTSKESPPVSTSDSHTASTASILKIDNDDIPLFDKMSKENTPLPPIDHDQLSNPITVVNKYPKLLTRKKLPTLAVKLACEAFFGPEILSYCTFRGVGPWHALPEKEAKKMKEYMMKLSMPAIVSSRLEFENVWAKCVESVGQKCKNLRNARLAKMKLK